MAKCLYCNKKGWFLSVDNNGLCVECHDTYLPGIVNDCRIVAESGKIIAKTKNVETLLSRAKIAIECCKRLQEFSDKGVPTLTPEPREVAREIAQIAAEAAEREINDTLFQARQTFEDATTDTGKLGGYNKGIKRLDKLMNELDDVSSMELAIETLRRERDSSAITLKVRKADLLIAQSKENRAKDVLIEALHLLTHDATDDDLQKQEREKIVRKLRDLKAEIPPSLS